jgi:hypothetical protein
MDEFDDRSDYLCLISLEIRKANPSYSKIILDRSWSTQYGSGELELSHDSSLAPCIISAVRFDCSLHATTPAGADVSTITAQLKKTC